MGPSPESRFSFQVLLTSGEIVFEIAKPGTVTDFLKLIKDRTSIFLLDGALSKVNEFFETQSKQRLAAKVQLIDDSSPFLRMFGKLSYKKDL